jgi:hypothetical protein
LIVLGGCGSSKHTCRPSDDLGRDTGGGHASCRRRLQPFAQSCRRTGAAATRQRSQVGCSRGPAARVSRPADGSLEGPEVAGFDGAPLTTRPDPTRTTARRSGRVPR